ncbi:MAG TPA: SAM-dependent methyltransferase [Pyrinomonadaceae bacterium]|jgi:methyltransferase (TIGR00027 family)
MKPISKTAFYCCGVRMQDAESANPVCGDVYAKNFMSEDGLRVFEAFKDETSPNASNVVRHRIIDDFLRAALLENSDLRIVTVGAGFDSRPYRLAGGVWIELDEPQVIEYKNERLPVEESANPLHRIPMDFATDSLEEKLAPFAGTDPVVIVIEGVFVYLDENEIIDVLSKLRRLFPRHKLICDLMSRAFFEKYGRTLHEKINDIGTVFRVDAVEPEEIFLAHGYRRRHRISIIERASELGLIRIPKIVLKTVLRTLANGLAIYVFETN